MSKESDKQNDESAKVDPPPGPVDHGREGGMATREKTPELTEPSHGD
ncbi:hypothetical protein ACGFK1_05010 [Mycobacterium sp. NPDC048908]